MKKLAALLSFVSVLCLADEGPQELYCENESGGFIAITLKPCELGDKISKEYPYAAYATEDKSGTKVHKGCWVRPDTSDAPRGEDIRIIPLVNSIWDSGDKVTIPASYFRPNEEEIVAPPVVVHPDT